MPLSRLIGLLAVAALVQGLAGCGPAEPPLLRLVATDFAFSGPHRIGAGTVRLRLVNQGHTWHDALVTALPEGARIETYIDSARAGQEVPLGAVDAGGPGLVAPGDSAEVVLRLEPGRYAVLGRYDNHFMIGMTATLTVTADDASDVPPPEPDVELALRDGHVTLADPLHAGLNVIHATSAGSRSGPFTVYRLHEGRTPADFEAWQAAPRDPPPAVPVGGVTDLAPGHEAWVRLTLTLGRYVIVGRAAGGEPASAGPGPVEAFTVE